MPFRPFHSRRPLAGLVIPALLALGGASHAQAGSTERPPQVVAAAPVSTPSPTPKYKITARPHLLAVGPMGVDVTPVAGPRVRKPPLLPTPKPVEPPLDAKPATPLPQDSSIPKATEPSAFSPDAPPVLLPQGQPSTTTTAGKKEEPRDNALVPANPGEPDLKDAVMYFDTPVGPHGSRASIPMVVPFTSPTPAPQPESRATYRKEKE